MLEEDHGIGIPHRGREQPFHVQRRRGRDDLQAGNRHRPVLHALRMLGAEARPVAVRRADDERQRDLSRGHVAGLGDLVGDHVPADREEIGEHDLRDRSQPGHRRSHRRPDDRLLGNGRVSHAPGPEPLEEPEGGLEDSARSADVLAEEDHALVARHLLRNAGGDGVPVGQFRHDDPPSAHTSFSMTSTPEGGQALAASVASSTARSTARSMSRRAFSSIPIPTNRTR